jgi:hypothetical protein
MKKTIRWMTVLAGLIFATPSFAVSVYIEARSGDCNFLVRRILADRSKIKVQRILTKKGFEFTKDESTADLLATLLLRHQDTCINFGSSRDPILYPDHGETASFAMRRRNGDVVYEASAESTNIFNFTAGAPRRGLRRILRTIRSELPDASQFESSLIAP